MSSPEYAVSSPGRAPLAPIGITTEPIGENPAGPTAVPEQAHALSSRDSLSLQEVIEQNLPLCVPLVIAGNDYCITVTYEQPPAATPPSKPSEPTVPQTGTIPATVVFKSQTRCALTPPTSTGPAASSL